VKTGMLWLDNDPHTSLPVKVTRAAEYYHKKYGQVPTLCLVNPSMLIGFTDEARRTLGDLHVDPHRAIQPGHLWIGAEDKN
jgi:hypothetical protein